MRYSGIETNAEIKKEIKKISIDSEISIADICKKLDILPQAYQNLFKKKNLSFLDVAKILDCLGYYLELKFEKKR